MSVERHQLKRGIVWVARVRAPDGREVERRFPRKADALAWERQKREEKRAGSWTWPSAQRKSVAAVVDEYLSRPSLAATTLMTDRQATDSFLSYLGRGAARPLSSIGPRDLEGWLASQLDAGYAPRTIDRRARTLRHLFAFAKRRGYVSSSPWVDDIRTPPVRPVDRPPLTAAEVDAIVTALDPPYDLAVTLAATIGLRWGEVFGLTRRHVDLDSDSGTLVIAQANVMAHDGGRMLGPAKSASSHRVVDIPPPVALWMRKHLDALPPGGDALVFPSPEGELFFPSNFSRRVWQPALKRAGLYDRNPRPTFHDLRRMVATGLVSSGVDPKTAQSLLGHSSVRLTLEVYAQASTLARRQAVELITKALNLRALAAFSGESADGSAPPRGESAG